MDTVNSRKQIGFPKERGEWAKSDAVFDEHTLRIAGHPVMEDWELEYMNTLARIATGNGGNVLEIGYGLGLSARAIQAYDVDAHFVVECHPDVVARCVADMRDAIIGNRLHMFSGFWEDVTNLMADKTFDGILFDTYPLREEEIHANHFWFFKEAFRLLKPGGILTYYSDEASGYSEMHMQKLKEAGFLEADISLETCKVDPPADCEYWQAKTIIAPVVRKSR